MHPDTASIYLYIPGEIIEDQHNADFCILWGTQLFNDIDKS